MRAIQIRDKFTCDYVEYVAEEELDESKQIMIDEETLNQIRKTKCFDIENNCVVDYDNSEVERIEELKMEMYRAGRYLVETDYISNKLAEAVSKYIESGDNTEVLLLRATYKEQLEKRADARKTVDELEVVLKDY